MKRIFVCSPLKADTPTKIQRNIHRAQELCKLACEAGVAPFAPHAFYTLFLDDTDVVQRILGMESGVAWLKAADELWAWTRNGISTGMEKEIALARELGIPVVLNPMFWHGVES